MIRTVRTECLDWMLVLGSRHLERVLRAYAAHYNEARPHRGLDLKMPEPRPDPLPRPADGARVRRHAVLGGLIHEDYPCRLAGSKVFVPFTLRVAAINLRRLVNLGLDNRGGWVLVT